MPEQYTLVADGWLGPYIMKDGEQRELFTLKTALYQTGEAGVRWRNPETGIGGDAIHLTAACIAGFLSAGLSLTAATSAAHGAVRQFTSHDNGQED